jgi:hypothetical protein
LVPACLCCTHGNRDMRKALFYNGIDEDKYARYAALSLTCLVHNPQCNLSTPICVVEEGLVHLPARNACGRQNVLEQYRAQLRLVNVAVVSTGAVTTRAQLSV